MCESKVGGGGGGVMEKLIFFLKKVHITVMVTSLAYLWRLQKGILRGSLTPYKKVIKCSKVVPSRVLTDILSL